MGQGLTAGITHLTMVNAYVAGTLRSKTPGTLGASVHLPRQLSGAALAGGNAATGISGFAFQGTNAHVILARSACIPNIIVVTTFLAKRQGATAVTGLSNNWPPSSRGKHAHARNENQIPMSRHAQFSCQIGNDLLQLAAIALPGSHKQG